MRVMRGPLCFATLRYTLQGKRGSGDHASYSGAANFIPRAGEAGTRCKMPLSKDAQPPPAMYLQLHNRTRTHYYPLGSTTHNPSEATWGCLGTRPHPPCSRQCHFQVLLCNCFAVASGGACCLRTHPHGVGCQEDLLARLVQRVQQGDQQGVLVDVLLCREG